MDDAAAEVKAELDNVGWKLSETIRVTRGCHIEAERRLLDHAALINHANLYYGCWSAVLTLLALDQRFASLALPAACFASSVALWAAYASVEKCELRAQGFYHSYLQLQDLWARSEDLETRGQSVPSNRDTVWNLREEYYRVLASTENHTEDDYIAYLHGEYIKGKGNEPSSAQLANYRLHRVRYWLLRFAVYVLVPAILLCAPHIVEMAMQVFG